MLFGGLHPTILDSDGTTHPVSLPPGLIGADAQLGGVQVGHNGTLVAANPTGITFLDGASNAVATATYAYPTDDEPCGPPSGQVLSTTARRSTRSPDAAGTPASQQPTGRCLAQPRVAVADNGAVWILAGLLRQGAAHFLIERIDRY